MNEGHTLKAGWRAAANAVIGMIAMVATGLIAAADARAECLGGGYAIETGGIIDVVPHPADAETLFVLQSAPHDGVSLLKSCDNGETWTPTALTADFYTVLSIAIDPTDTETVYAMTYRGALVSTDGGINWSETEIPGAEIVFGFDGTLYSFDMEQIYKRPADVGDWSALTPVPRQFEVLRPHPSDPNRLHVGQYYSMDGGASWQQVLPAPVRDVRYSESNPMRMIATGTPGLLSDDGGVNWYEFATREFEIFSTSNPEGTAVAIDRADSDSLWVVTRLCGIWQSGNAGYTWHLPDEGLTGESQNCWLGEGYPEVKRLIASPANADRWYAETSDGLFVTDDNGALWRPINGVADESGGTEPPPNPYSGNADISVSISGVPKSYTPPTTLRFSAELRQNGPDTAREVTFVAAGSSVITSSTYPGCTGGSCEFGDLPAGTVIRFTIEREILGGTGPRCNGDVLEVIVSAYAMTDDPNPDNNVAVGETERKNNTSIISGCPGEGLLQPVDEDSGGGSTGFGLLAVLGAFIARRRRAA